MIFLFQILYFIGLLLGFYTISISSDEISIVEVVTNVVDKEEIWTANNKKIMWRLQQFKNLPDMEARLIHNYIKFGSEKCNETFQIWFIIENKFTHAFQDEKYISIFEQMSLNDFQRPPSYYKKSS